MAGMSDTLRDKALNASSPTGAGGIPGTWTAYNAGAMKIQLTSNAPTAATAGTQIAGGSGYTTGGQALSTQSTASSAGSGVTLPATSAMSWTNSGSAWSIVGFELVDNAGARAWFGTFNGQPISVATSNTFQIAVGGISLSLA